MNYQVEKKIVLCYNEHNNKGDVNMLKKEQVLKILKKYGFYSLNRAPYLYQNKDDVGVYFVWPNIHYGNLERVLFFYDEESLDEEIYKYWWFLNHKNQLNLAVEFDNYDTLSPKVTYKYKGNILTVSGMKNFDVERISIVDENEVLKKKQLIRTANILILILREKFKVQNETYFKVLELQENLKQLTNTYNKKLNQYNNSKEEIVESYELLMDENDESDKLANSLINELSALDTIDDIRLFIESMFSYLTNIDSSEIHLQNIYLLNRYPFEIEDIKKKIEILDNALKSKKKLFKSKQNIDELLKEVDDNSQCKKMINVNLYIEKEKKRIKEKYENHEEIDENVLGDYILNFEKLNIDIPEMIEVSNKDLCLYKEEVLEKLKLNYEKLTKKEKSACHIASSFLGECLNCLRELKNIDELGTNEIISQLVLNKQIERFNEAFKYLDNYLNAKCRVKYLSTLKVDSFENFMNSLVATMHVLEQLKLKLDNSFIGYYNNKNKEIIAIYLKNLCYFEQKSSYVATILPNVPVYYSPVQILKPLDIVENEELVVRENEIVFLLSHKVNIKQKQNGIKVTKYEKDKVIKKKDYIVVVEMKEKNSCTYYEDTISSIESDGI